MALSPQRSDVARSSLYRRVRRWQIALHGILLLAALVLGIWGYRRALFLLFLIPIAFTPFSYARLRLQHDVEQALRSMRRAAAFLPILTGFGVLLDVVMIAQVFTARLGSPVPILHSTGISWLGAIWFSAHALLFLGYVIIDFARWSGRRLTQALQHWFSLPPEAPVSPERRRFLQQVGILGAGAPFLLSISGVKLTYDFRVEEREITLPYWPPALDGLRVAHLSDIHVGGAMNRERLLRMAALTNNARPDLVVHTGDFLTHRQGDFDLPLYEALARISAPYGQWACLGNHDFDMPERLVYRLRQAGVITLRNTLTTLSLQGQSLEIGGIDFQLRGLGIETRSYARVVHSLGPRGPLPRLLLIHDPRAFATIPNGCADLVLSGHTHGGQVGIQLDQDHALTVVGLCGIPDQGVFHRKDMTLFITRCVGFYGYPMRLGIPPEIALLTLRAPQARPSPSTPASLLENTLPNVFVHDRAEYT